jgi:hypothetical protein
VRLLATEGEDVVVDPGAGGLGAGARVVDVPPAALAEGAALLEAR